MKKLPGWITGEVIATTLGLLWFFERRRPLRRRVEPSITRIGRNLSVAGVSGALMTNVDAAITLPFAFRVEHEKWGLLNGIVLPLWLEVVVAVILLDWTLYYWHVLNHKIPFLWRFHQVHHVDRDLDASTALRFHFGELLFSVGWRFGQIFLFGISPLSLSVWQTFLFISILFHHSNVELPIHMERWLNRLVVTPRMHGIHHSIVENETNSNWSSGLTLWDWLHGTLKLNVPQEAITIGVPAYQDPRELRLWAILTMPFRRQRPSWSFVGGGKPERLPIGCIPEM
jgi:sterol desaturase/sphingolipid hydroxylase (fatty acid hydroxylase superfamily)